MTILQRRPNDFAHRNLLLQVTLGLVNTARKFDRLLDAHASPVDVASDGSPSPETADTVLLILGIIAFRRRLGTFLQTLPDPPDPDRAVGLGPPLKGLHR